MNRILWVASPAIFSLIGLLAAYLYHEDWVILGAIIGAISGLGIAVIATAGEK